MTAPISNEPTTHGYTTMRDATLDAMIFWIGYFVLDSLFSYPERRFLSTTMFPIQNRAWLAS